MNITDTLHGLGERAGKQYYIDCDDILSAIKYIQLYQNYKETVKNRIKQDIENGVIKIESGAEMLFADLEME